VDDEYCIIHSMSERKDGMEGGGLFRRAYGIGETDEETAPQQPNIVLTPEERRVFGQLFQAADVEGTGVVTGDVAVKFFEKSGLNPRILGEVNIRRIILSDLFANR
jgi:hypothetical protein